MPGGFGGRSSLKAEEPEKLPWLIRIDEFVDGRRYQGHRDLAVRVSGMGGGSSVLNEAVSLNVLATAGEVAQKYAYTSFTVNGRPTTARLVVEHPDETFTDRIGDDGVLYKSLASSSFTDQGNDQTDYQDDFQQITKKGSQDLQPVINLIRWVTTASDEEFTAKLGDYVDVESLANYVAVQNLIANFDDMSGPGKNYYLWYDLTTKKFSVVGWDYNLTFSGSATTGPHESTTMGGGNFPRQGGQQQGGQQQGGQRGGPGGGIGGNTLKERFLAGAAFTDVYENAYRELYQKIYGSGTALTALDQITTVVENTKGSDATTLATESNQLTTFLQERTKSLATDEVIAQG
ncbi:CotH kinase family protein [Cryptosporangium japonicum]|uniref:Spore coat protein CotH n=1 Tax=Cryptosporangium japonicum TaxID=80872 RepID=A0ABN0TL80_9ACTN